MQRPVNSLLKERVKQIHYSSPDYKPEPGMTHNYNVCPMCGMISKLQSIEQTEESDIDISVMSDSNFCNTCNNVKYLHPHIHEWINLLFNNLQVQESMKQPEPKQLEAKAQEPNQGFIDVELVSDKEN